MPGCNDPPGYLTYRRSRVQRIELAVEVAVESHGRTARKDHAQDHQQQLQPEVSGWIHSCMPARNHTRCAGPASRHMRIPLKMGRNAQEKADQRERHGKNSMGEFDEREVVFNMVHGPWVPAAGGPPFLRCKILSFLLPASAQWFPICTSFKLRALIGGRGLLICTSFLLHTFLLTPSS